ncbi:MAG: hypothetical protein R3E01_02680 [Pirellulaceae bacterium]
MLSARSGVLLEIQNIPSELTERRQWVIWRYDDGSKVPYEPGGRRAKSNDVATWTTYENAVEAYEQGGWAGIGYMFAADDPYCGIDLDGCRDPDTGKTEDWAKLIIRDAGSYTEVSPSGTGWKIIGIGQNPFPAGKNIKLSGPKYPVVSEKEPGIEVYDKLRWFAVTGKCGAGMDHLGDLRKVLGAIFQEHHKPTLPIESPQHHTGNAYERCRNYVAQMPGAISGQAGHNATYAVACVAAKGFALPEDKAWSILVEFNERCQPPWHEHELRHKLDDAYKAPGENGYLLHAHSNVSPSFRCGDAGANPNDVVLRNYEEVAIEGDDGKVKTVKVPRSMSEVIDDLHRITDGWPRRVDNLPFVDDMLHGLSYFDRDGCNRFFGWLKRRASVHWTSGEKFVNRGEFFAEASRTCQQYAGIENYPHEPPVANLFYRSAAPQPGDGTHLRWLLDRFRPETSIDRDLIQAAMMTTLWGGPPGCRPAFVITAKEGRGVGKTKLAELIALVVGGFIDVNHGDSMHVIKERLLSPDAMTLRVGLLDNVKSHRLSWAELEGLVTSPIVSGRRLYVGEGRRPNLLTWFITLNGVSLATDMAQRAVVINLVRGENSATWYEETQRYIWDHRQAIIGDVVAALGADRLALPNYSRWGAWEHDILERLPEPAETQRVILERQAASNTDLDEADLLEDAIATYLRRLGYDPNRNQVRIPVGVLADWFNRAMTEKLNSAKVGRILAGMAEQRQLKYLTPGPSRTFGRCWIWTGHEADTVVERISNDLPDRIAESNGR